MKSFASQLIDWQHRYGRHDLPWQATSDPYRVWLSEIMLQQTQVQSVIGYFNRFVARFPSVATLASATEQEVLALWSGLGYYQRARNLHACAQKIMHHHGGQFPRTSAELMQLPGIGRSTAAAIAAIVFKERAAILDGNVKRVLARVFCVEAPWGSPALEKKLWQRAQTLLPVNGEDMPRYTQAIMDLGATVCRARNPVCGSCPVASHCLALKNNCVVRYPLPKPLRTIPQRHAWWCVLKNDHGVWLTQQPVKGIWPGLWVPWQLDRNALPKNWLQIAQHLIGVQKIRHTFSHYRLLVEAGVVVWQKEAPPSGASAALQFFSWDQALALPLPAPVHKLLLTLCPSGKANGGAPRRNSRF